MNLQPSFSLTGAVNAIMKYLGVQGVKRLTDEKVQAVQSDGTAQLTDGTLVRTSGNYRGLQAGQILPVLHTTGQGPVSNRAVGGAASGMIMANQIRQGIARRPVTPSEEVAPMEVEELFLTTQVASSGNPFSTGYTWRLYLRNQFFCVELPVINLVMGKVGPPFFGVEAVSLGGVLYWGNDTNSFLLSLQTVVTETGGSNWQLFGIFTFSPRPAPGATWTTPPAVTCEAVWDRSFSGLAGVDGVIPDWSSYFGLPSSQRDWRLDSVHHIVGTVFVSHEDPDLGVLSELKLVDHSAATVLIDYGTGGPFNTCDPGQLIYADSVHVQDCVQIVDSATVPGGPPGTPIPQEVSVWTGTSRAVVPGTSGATNPTALVGGALFWSRKRFFYTTTYYTDSIGEEWITTTYLGDTQGNAEVLDAVANNAPLDLYNLALYGSPHTGADRFFQAAHIFNFPSNQPVTPPELIEAFVVTVPYNLHSPVVDRQRPVTLFPYPAKIIPNQAAPMDPAFEYIVGNGPTAIQFPDTGTG